MRPERLQVLCEQLATNQVDLVELNLTSEGITDDNAKALAEALRDNSCIKKLYLPWNGIGPEGATALANLLLCHKNVTTLTSLYLDNNKIGNAGAVALGQMLKHNTTLKELYISENAIGDEGMQRLAAGLSVNCTLQRLGLSRNEITNTGAMALGEAMATNTGLTWLWLGSQNLYNEIGVQALLQGVQQNFFLRRLIADFTYANKEIQFHLLLNRSGRKILRQDETTVPDALWPKFLARQRVNLDLSVLYYYISTKPELFSKRVEVTGSQLSEEGQADDLTRKQTVQFVKKKSNRGREKCAIM